MTKIFAFTSLLFLAHQAFGADTVEYNIQIKDHKFVPASIEVPANTKFRLVVENLDDTAAEFESHDLGKEKIITAGKKATLIITPLKAGEYMFFDDFHSKETMGKLIAK